jgi:16S rRNA (cytosine967-C5)-methyltransferase
MTKISPARIAAFEILKKIETEKAFSSVLLPAFEEQLFTKDRGLCHQLTLGVLRKQIWLDRIIEQLTGKNVAGFDVEVVIALRLGLYQILLLDKIPAYSAINESVNLVHRAKKRSAAGLVNAVLRRALREENLTPVYSGEIDRISVETSHPRWLIEHWIDHFGIAETARIARANNQNPPPAFRLTARFYQRDSLNQQEIINELKSFDVRESELVGGCLIVNRSNQRLRELAGSGDLYFQEEGSQLVGRVVDLKETESFFDVCAAPGSKTTEIVANLFKGRPEIRNLLVAGDLHTHRLLNLRDNCRRQGLDQIEFIQYDSERPLPLAEESFEAVLADVPCSGTGTIRHHPEIRYFLEEKDFGELSAKQLKILRNASKLVKRGGRIVYSTCSLERSENEEVIGEFLKENTGFEKVRPESPEQLLTPAGFIRTFPHRDHLDGFFIAVFEKK